MLHLIPNVLSPGHYHVLPAYQQELIRQIQYWYVEDLKQARRFLKGINRDTNIDALTFYLLNEHHQEDLQYAPALFRKGIPIGLLSDCGCPAVADPGNALVQIAHREGVRVCPHTGPNAFLLTLMASGFNGQAFQFHGYLPNKQPMLQQKLLELEAESRRTGASHFFMETPYRNLALFGEICKYLHADTRLCIGCDLTGEQEWIRSMSVREWKSVTPPIHKLPAVMGIWVNGGMKR